MLTAVPGVQEVRRGVAELGVPAPEIVERLDVVEAIGNGFGVRFVVGAKYIAHSCSC